MILVIRCQNSSLCTRIPNSYNNNHKRTRTQHHHTYQYLYNNNFHGDKLTTAEARRNKSDGRCYLCLRQGHSANDCRSVRPCFYCKASNHHSSLSYRRFPISKRSSSSPSVKGTTKTSTAESKPSTAHALLASSRNDGLSAVTARLLPGCVSPGRCPMPDHPPSASTKCFSTREL